MRQHERDGLRMFVVDESGKLLRIGFLKDVEVTYSPPIIMTRRSIELLARVRPEGRSQHFLGVVEAAAHDEIVRHVHLVELFERASACSEVRDSMSRDLARHLPALPSSLSSRRIDALISSPRGA
jgi:hypothetical protein